MAPFFGFQLRTFWIGNPAPATDAWSFLSLSCPSVYCFETNCFLIVLKQIAFTVDFQMAVVFLRAPRCDKWFLNLWKAIRWLSAINQILTMILINTLLFILRSSHQITIWNKDCNTKVLTWILWKRSSEGQGSTNKICL